MAKKLKSKSPDARLFEMFENGPRQWGERYLSRNKWRIAAMYDYEDIKQDVFLVYLRTCTRYPEHSEEEIFKIYIAGVKGRLLNRARECFPNTYAYEEGMGKLVVELDEHTPLPSYENELATSMEVITDLLMKLPEELASVLKILINDFVGVSCIEQRKARRLSGKTRIEPLNLALARKANLDPSRDLIGELDKACKTITINPGD